MNIKITLSALLFCAFFANAQVGIGTVNPNSDAQLDITTTNRGLLLPRIALTNTTSPAPLSADVAGMTVYNTATAGDVTPGMYYNNGTVWVRIPQTLTNDWALAGNAGTTNGTDFLGTTDAQDLDIRTNNVIHHRFTQKGQLEVLNTGRSIFIGENAGDADNGSNNNNIFIGNDAGAAITNEANNAFVGHQSGRRFTGSTASGNASIGAYTFWNATTGENNTAIGQTAMMFPTNAGTLNTAVGYRSMGSGSFGGGIRNTGVGAYTLEFADGDRNTGIGYGAGRNLNAGDNNIAIGHEADFDLGTGSNNISIGFQAGGYTGLGANITRSNNIFIGANSATGETNSNRLYIENSASVTPLVYGEFDTNILRIGGQLQIGSNDDTTAASFYTFPTTAGTNGQFLQLNATGNLIWTTGGSDIDDWNLLGNAGTNPANDFLGTTDAQALVFRTNNLERMRIYPSREVRVGPAATILYAQDMFTGSSTTIGDHAVNGYSPDTTGVGVFGSQDPGSLSFRAAGGSFTGTTLALYALARAATSNGIEVTSGTPATGLGGTGNGIIVNSASRGILAYSADTSTNKLAGYFEANNTGGATRASASLAGSFPNGRDYGAITQSDFYGLYAQGAVWSIIGVGNMFIAGNTTATGTKAFSIDHPLDPENKILRHFSIESDEVINLYRGNEVFNSNGEATVTLPDYFHAINRDFSYQLTPIGASMPGIFIKEEVSNGKFVIAGGVSGKKVSWQVTAERNDKYLQTNPDAKQNEVNKTSEEKGRYLDPKAWGQPESKSILPTQNKDFTKKVNPTELIKTKTVKKQ